MLAITTAIIWWSSRAVPLPDSRPSAVDPAAITNLDPATANQVTPSVDDEQRTTVPLDPSAPTYTVHGHLLTDPRATVLGAEIVAYAGQAGERSGLLAMMAAGGQRRGGPNAFTATGPVLARVPVAADGSFALSTNAPDLRLTVEHDLYGLPLPEIVHVPVKARAIEVVLAPYLGGCVHGRLLGGDPTGIQNVRLATAVDPMSVLRDPRAFLGGIARSAGPSAHPSSDGRFTFRAVVPGCMLTLTAEGDAAAGRTTQPAIEASEVRDVALTIAAATTLSVRVVDEAGAPIAGAHAVVNTEEPTDQVARIRGAARADTDLDGKAILRGLLPGSWQVRASADGYRSTSQPVTLPTDADLQLQLTRGASIRGIVVDSDGAAIANAKVGWMPSIDVPMLGDMTAQLGTETLAAVAAEGVTTDAEGRFALPGLDDEDPVNIVATATGRSPTLVHAVPPGTDDVRVELAPATAVTVRVVADEDGAPLATFTLELRATMFLTMSRSIRTMVVTDAKDGIAQLDDLPAGDFTLAASTEDRSEVTQPLHLGGGSPTVAHELRLVLASRIRGRVVDGEGNGIAGAMVQKSRGGALDNPMLAMFQDAADAVRTDARGAFELTGLPPGRLQLSATADGFAAGKSARTEIPSGGTVDGVDITLGHGGSIDGVLRTVHGESADDFTLIVQNEGSQKTTSSTAGPDGRFRVDNLEPGRYQVQAMHPSALRMMRGAGNGPGRSVDVKNMMRRVSDSTVSQRCTVMDGKATTVELDASDLGSGTRLSLRVTIGGEPLNDGIVECSMVDDGRVRIGFLTDGEVTFGALRPGSMRVQVRTGMTLTPVGGPQAIDVPPGIDQHRVTIELPGGEISGRVVDTEGRPLAAVLVRLLRGNNSGDDDRFGTAITGADGSFTFRALQPDTYGLVAADAMRQEANGAASRKDGIAVAAGEHRSGIELRAQPAVGASIRVVDTTGAPLPGAMVVAIDAEGRPLGNFAFAVAGADGLAQLGGLPRGGLRIVGRAPGLSPDATALVEVLPGQHLDLTLPLARGARVALEARGRDGQPLRGAEVRARCSGGAWIPSLLLLEGRGVEGRFDLGRLAPGNWEFRIDSPGADSFSVTRAIGDGAAITILATPVN